MLSRSRTMLSKRLIWILTCLSSSSVEVVDVEVDRVEVVVAPEVLVEVAVDEVLVFGPPFPWRSSYHHASPITRTSARRFTIHSMSTSTVRSMVTSRFLRSFRS